MQAFDKHPAIRGYELVFPDPPFKMQALGNLINIKKNVFFDQLIRADMYEDERNEGHHLLQTTTDAEHYIQLGRNILIKGPNGEILRFMMNSYIKTAMGDKNINLDLFKAYQEKLMETKNDDIYNLALLGFIQGILHGLQNGGIREDLTNAMNSWKGKTNKIFNVKGKLLSVPEFIQWVLKKEDLDLSPNEYEKIQVEGTIKDPLILELIQNPINLVPTFLIDGIEAFGIKEDYNTFKLTNVSYSLVEMVKEHHLLDYLQNYTKNDFEKIVLCYLLKKKRKKVEHYRIMVIA